MHAQHESGRWWVGSRSVGNAEKAGGWVLTEQVQKQHTASAATTLAIKAAYGFYDRINLKCSMPNNKIALSS